MTPADRRYMGAHYIATEHERTHRRDWPAVGVWLAASVFCAVMWGALGFAVVALIFAIRGT